MGLGSPSQGGRVLLERRHADADGATYRVELRGPDGVWEGEAKVDGRDGAVDMTGLDDPAAPGWLVDGARAFLRTAWRDVSGAGGRWPRRIHRWRVAK